MTDDEHTQDEELHNSDEKLRNSDDDARKDNRDPFIEPFTRLNEMQRKLKLSSDRIFKHTLEELNLLSTWTQAKIAQDLMSVSPRADSGADHRALSFTKGELEGYVKYRKEGLAQKSLDWVDRSSRDLSECTHGEITETNVTAFRAQRQD